MHMEQVHHQWNHENTWGYGRYKAIKVVTYQYFKTDSSKVLEFKNSNSSSLK